MPRAPERERDGFSSKVPWWLNDIFHTRRLMLECHGRIGILKTQIAGLTEEAGGDRMNLPQIQAALELARALIWEGVPYRPCDCQSGEECSKCNETRWVTRAQYRPGANLGRL